MTRPCRIKKATVGLHVEARVAIRREQSIPILNANHTGLFSAEGRAHGERKKAVNATLNALDALRYFVCRGRLEIDNNPVARRMWLIAPAKKTLIGASSHEAAQAWVIFYRLIESVRLNRVVERNGAAAARSICQSDASAVPGRVTGRLAANRSAGEDCPTSSSRSSVMTKPIQPRTQPHISGSGLPFRIRSGGDLYGRQPHRVARQNNFNKAASRGPLYP